MKKRRILIVIAIIVIIIIIVIINKKLKTKNNEIDAQNQNLGNTLSETNNNVPSYLTESNMRLQKITSKEEFFMVKEIFESFTTMINQKNSDGLMNVIDKNYLTKNNINTKNVIDLFKNNDFSYYIIEEATEYKQSDDVSLYVLKIRDKNNVKNSQIISNDSKFLIKANTNTKTFAIYPNYNDSSNEYLQDEVINKNNYNTFTTKEVSDNDIAKYYLTIIQNMVSEDAKYFYEMKMDETSNDFKSFEEFQEYAKGLNIGFDNLNVSSKKQYAGTIYEITDSNNNYFKITVYSFDSYNIAFTKFEKQDNYNAIYTKNATDSTAVSNSAITNFMDSFINSTVSNINTETAGLSDNKIRKYYDEHTSEVNSMGIYNAEDLVNLSNQIVGMRWSKGITYTGVSINDKTEENGYVKYNLKLSYTLNEEIDLYLCVAKNSNTTPQMKIETTGVADNDDDTYTE